MQFFDEFDFLSPYSNIVNLMIGIKFNYAQEILVLIILSVLYELKIINSQASYQSFDVFNM